jgi:hypothetical protein
MVKGSWVEYQPLASIDSDSPIEFYVSSKGDEYIDYITLYYVKVKIRKNNADGTFKDLEENEKVGPINNWLHSLYSQIDLSLNGEQVTSSTGDYHYKAYLQTLLTYGEDAKKVSLRVNSGM